MGNSDEFKCGTCGKIHSDEFSYAFTSPYRYNHLDEEYETNKDLKANLGSDFCVINDEEFFIRVLLEVPIIKEELPMLWGVWVSVSKEYYDEYHENFEKDNTGKVWFGEMANSLPHYSETRGVKMDVVMGTEKDRPLVKPQETDHELFSDFRDGISLEKARILAEAFRHTKSG